MPPIGFDDWGGDDGDGKNFKLLNEEKHAILGEFAMRCIAFHFGQWYLDVMS